MLFAKEDGYGLPDVTVTLRELRTIDEAVEPSARHDHAARYMELAVRGVCTVFLSLPDLAGSDDLDRCAAPPLSCA